MSKKLLRIEDKIDRSTGEVISETSVVRFNKSVFNDEYYFVYYDKYAELIKNLKPRSAEILLSFLIIHSNPVNNRINMYEFSKKEAIEYCGYSASHISRHLSSLCKAELIVKIGKSEYMVNPYVAFKSKSENRIKAIEFFKKVKELI